MQVFVSWSGDRSRQIAEAIRNWLPKVIQSVRPWMSDEDIGAGARWLSEVSGTLNSARVGLICLTPENQHNPWLLFEAGALSKTLDQTCVCPLLFDMSPGQLVGPLTQFQASPMTRDGMGKVLSTINRVLDDRSLEPQQLDEILDVWWPKLDERLRSLPLPATPAATRSTGDQLEELLLLARENLRRENLRLEASMERDEKLDSLLGFMEQAGAVIGTMQSHAQRLQSSLQRRFDAAQQSTDNANFSIDAQDAGSMASVPFDVGSMTQLAAAMREMQERDKARTESMLAQVPGIAPGEGCSDQTCPSSSGNEDGDGKA